MRGNIPDNAIGALAQLLRHGVPLIDDEVLVENLEDLASLKLAHGDQGARGRSVSGVGVVGKEVVGSAGR